MISLFYLTESLPYISFDDTKGRRRGALRVARLRDAADDK